MATATKAPAKRAAPAGAAKKAAASKPTVKAKPKAEYTPLEVDEPEYREPVRPTPAKIAETKFAVIMLAWFPERVNGSDFGRPADRDFFGTDVEKDAKAFFEGQNDWASEDVSTDGDIFHASVLIIDTKEVRIADIKVYAPDDDWVEGCTEFLREFPETMFSRQKRDVMKKVAEAAIVGVKKPRGKREVAKTDSVQYTDEELATMPIEDVGKLPSGLRGKATALRQKRKREEAAAAAEDTPVAEAPANPVKRRPKAKAAAV